MTWYTPITGVILGTCPFLLPSPGLRRKGACRPMGFEHWRWSRRPGPQSGGWGHHGLCPISDSSGS